MLDGIVSAKEIKRTAQIQFAAEARRELLHLGGPRNERLPAERRAAACSG